MERFDVGCVAVLHHNKKMTNLHIHLTFSERQSREEVERKVASRNMFYDENGKHVRTKKEILDEDGNVRSGCKIIKKGEVYETNFFYPKNPYFKDKSFLDDMKKFYADICNSLVKDEKEILSVFDPKGPYLATKKIGKNNPREKEMKQDNAMRQEWNTTVDRALIAGALDEEMVYLKESDITIPVAESVKEHGRKPGLFAEIMIKAITHLKALLWFMQNEERYEITEDGYILSDKPITIDVTPDSMPQKEMPPRPDRFQEEAELMCMEQIHKKLQKQSGNITKIENQIATYEKKLAGIPNNIFHRKE